MVVLLIIQSPLTELRNINSQPTKDKELLLKHETELRSIQKLEVMIQPEQRSAVQFSGDKDKTRIITDGVFTGFKNWTRGPLLGRGRHGNVYLCVDKYSGRSLNVAVKETQCSMESDVLHKEIEILKKTSSDRIVQFFGFEQGMDTLRIFLEYLSGGSVYEEISEAPLCEAEAKKRCRHVLQGLEYLHKENIIHRDLKCKNILLDGNKNAKLADFGVSKRLESMCTASRCRTASIGTVHWMAPEVINIKKFDGYHREVDIWSSGITVVEMLTKEPPYSDLETHQAAYIIGSLKSGPDYDIPSETSSDLREFLKLAFKIIPSERPSAKEMLKHRWIRDTD